jgi:hypothetical protein
LRMSRRTRSGSVSSTLRYARSASPPSLPSSHLFDTVAPPPVLSTLPPELLITDSFLSHRHEAMLEDSFRHMERKPDETAEDRLGFQEFMKEMVGKFRCVPSPFLPLSVLSSIEC